MSAPEGEPGSAASQLSSAWERLLQSGADLLGSRFELAAIELAEEQARLRRVVLFGAIAAVFGLLFLGLLSALIVVLFWPFGQWPALLVLTVVYAGVCAIAVWQLRRLVVDRPRPFAATRAELARDLAQLRARRSAE